MAHNAYLADCGGAGEEAHQRTAELSASSNFWVGYTRDSLFHLSAKLRFSLPNRKSYILTMVTVVAFTGMSLAETLDEKTLSSSFTIICGIVSAGFTYLGYSRLKPRPHPIHPLDKDQSILFEGFYKIYRTLVTVFHDFPNAGKFLVFVMLTEGAVAAGNAVSVVFLKDVINMSNSEVNVAFSVATLISICGSGTAWFLSKRTTPYSLLGESLDCGESACNESGVESIQALTAKNSISQIATLRRCKITSNHVTVFAIILYISANIYFATLVHTPQEATFAMALLGFMIGFYYSVMRAVFAVMIPAGVSGVCDVSQNSRRDYSM